MNLFFVLLFDGPEVLSSTPDKAYFLFFSSTLILIMQDNLWYTEDVYEVY